MVVVTNNTLVTHQLSPDLPHQDRRSVSLLPDVLVSELVVKSRKSKPSKEECYLWEQDLSIMVNSEASTEASETYAIFYLL